MRGIPLEQTPDTSAIYREMDRWERQMRHCTCEWDGAPDALQPRKANPACPVHAEDDIEMARRQR